MFPVVFLALILIPIAEIAVFIKVGGLIGVLPTLALVIGIAIFGTWLLRQQGLQTFIKVQSALNRGEIPVGEMLDGFFLVLAALLMMTPGLLTDAVGFVLLIPAVRKALGAITKRWALSRTVTTEFYHTPPGSPTDSHWHHEQKGQVIEGEAQEVDPADTIPHSIDQNDPKRF